MMRQVALDSFRRRLALAAAAAGLLAAAALPLGSAFADQDTSTGTATISAGPLELTVPSAINWTATLTGYDQAVQTPVDLNVTDATGSASGWNVTLAATHFQDGTKQLPSNTLSVNGSATSKDDATAFAQACATGSTCVLPSNATTYPVAVTTAASNPTAVKIASAAADTGLGSVDLDANFWLSLPANVKAGTYVSTLTFNLNTGP